MNGAWSLNQIQASTETWFMRMSNRRTGLRAELILYLNMIIKMHSFFLLLFMTVKKISCRGFGGESHMEVATLKT
jgi:hypothetical protein